MAKPKRTNRPGTATQGGASRPVTRNGSGSNRTTTAGAAGRPATAPRPAAKNGAGPARTTPASATTGQPTTNGDAAATNATNGATKAVANGTAKVATNGMRQTSTGTSGGAGRAQTTAAASAARPIVSSIRERTGTQRPANRKRYEVKKNWLQERLPIIIPTVSIALVVVLFVLIARPGGGSGSTGVSQSVMSSLTGVSSNTFATVGSGGLKNPFTGLPAGPVLTDNGKPEVLYIGAEYCPYCAAERWSMVIALSRFGTFTGLKTMSSSSTDTFPSTNTFTFVDATYTSKYITFVSKEIEDQNGNKLQSMTADEQTIFQTYDAPPYTTQQSAGGIPFIDFGNQYITLSSGFSPALLHANADANGTPLTYNQITTDLKDPNNPVTQAIVGNANYMTAAICKLTNNQPSNVCGTSVIQQLKAQLPNHS